MLREVSRSLDVHSDPAGTVVYIASLSMVVAGLTPGTTTAVLSLILILAGGLLFVLFIFLERRHPHPVLDPKLFRNRRFAAGNLASVLTFIPTGAFPLVVSLYLQFVRGLNPLDVGLILLTGEVVFAILTFLSGLLSDRYGSRMFTIPGSIFIFVSLILFSFVDRAAPLGQILGILVLLGIGRGFFGSSNAASAMSAVQPEDYTIANGFRTTVNNTAGVISVPMVTAFMTLVIPYDRAVQIVTGVPFANEAEILSFMQAVSFSVIILAFMALLAIMPDLSAKSKSIIQQKSGYHLH